MRHQLHNTIQADTVDTVLINDVRVSTLGFRQEVYYVIGGYLGKIAILKLAVVDKIV